MKAKREVNIPFSGFYHTPWSDIVDSYEEGHSENGADSDENLSLPEELRLTAEDYTDALSRALDYPAAYTNIAKTYGDMFNRSASELLGFDLGLTWATMTSPRAYNFVTDRIFMNISWRTVKALFAKSKADGHTTLESTIRARFTSYDGFASYYRNDLESWLAKPLATWDHNEIGTLLIAVLESSPGYESAEFAMELYYLVSDDGCYHEIDSAVDWKKYEEVLADTARTRAEAFAEEHPDFVPPPPRCKTTPDLFG